jgi:hypothetical protein
VPLGLKHYKSRTKRCWPALGFWGFIVCRGSQQGSIHAFNRTLFKNFCQERGVLILSEADLRRMVLIANRGSSPARFGTGPSRAGRRCGRHTGRQCRRGPRARFSISPSNSTWACTARPQF